MDDKIFRSVLGTYIKDLNQGRLKYLQNLKIFDGWDRVSLVGLLTHIYVRSPKRDDYIYKEGEKNNNIYIVVIGELELVKKYDPKKEKKQKKEADQMTNDEKFKNRYLLEDPGVKKEVNIIKLTEGNYFGDEEGFGSDVKNYSVKVKSSVTKLFLIPKDVRIYFFTLKTKKISRKKLIFFRKL